MENRKTLLIIFGIIAVILGWTLFKKFDFETLKFEKPALAILYIIIFVFAIYLLIKNFKKRS